VNEEEYTQHLLNTLTHVCSRTVSLSAPRAVKVGDERCVVNDPDRFVCTYTSMTGEKVIHIVIELHEKRDRVAL